MTTKQITVAILLLSALTNRYVKAMQTKTSHIDIPCNLSSHATWPTQRTIYLAYPAINDFANKPQTYEKLFRSILILHLADLEDHGKTPVQLKKFEAMQLKSMKQQKQKIVKNMSTAPLKTGGDPQQKSIELQKQP